MHICQTTRHVHRKWDITNFFKDGEYNWIEHDAAKSVYSISFTEENDSLTLWRAYGRDGRGAGIVIPASGFKQSDETNLIGRNLNRSKEMQSKDSENTDDEKPDVYMPENLFEVKYINLSGKKEETGKEKTDKKIANELLQSLWEPLEKIREIKEKIEKEIKGYENKEKDMKTKKKAK
jgi:hypothetical protein